MSACYFCGKLVKDESDSVCHVPLVYSNDDERVCNDCCDQAHEQQPVPQFVMPQTTQWNLSLPEVIITHATALNKVKEEEEDTIELLECWSDKIIAATKAAAALAKRGSKRRRVQK